MTYSEHAEQIRAAHALGPHGWCRCGLIAKTTPAEHAAHVAAMAAEAAQRHAEKIAAEALAAHGTDYTPRGWFCECGHVYGASPMGLPDLIQAHRMTAAALQALTESENAR